MKKFLLSIIIVASVSLQAQNINSETVDFRVLKAPQTSISANSRTYNVSVNSPYNLSKEDVIKQSKIDHEAAVANYKNTVADSEKDFQETLKNYNDDVVKARETFTLESAEFKKFNILHQQLMEKNTAEDKKQKLWPLQTGK